MGKPTGFLEYKRELPADREPLERVKDWGEFHHHMADKDIRKQGGRCMDCGVPFCHTGSLIKGMASGCPINNLIPEWNDLVYRGDWKQAIERLHRTNNFPEFTGRVCPAPCEGSCVLGINEPPVTIKNHEYHIAERGWEEGWIVPEAPETRTGKKVAVVGSGPAGLSAADQLNKVGHDVTVFERADRPGGLLMYGIPNMKLDKKLVVERRLKKMEAEGIKFVCNTEVGKDFPVDKLKAEYDAVVLAGGATKGRDLPIEGRDAKGVHLAMEFLKANTKSLLDSNHADGNYITAKDKHVVVIGGGDTGTDCVGTSLRHGCKNVVQLEIMPRPADERQESNPWPEWPKVYMMDYGQQEAAAIQGEDPRKYLVQTEKFEKDADGNVKALHIVEIEWEFPQGGGRPTPKPKKGTEKVIPADLVLLAMGFLGPEDQLVDQLNVDRDERSNVKADHEVYTTSEEGIFAAGDMRRGQSLVVWAINEGRGCAREVDKYLMGETTLV